MTSKLELKFSLFAVIIQVQKHDALSMEDPGIVSAIASVLAASQAYMRKREVSF
jgi:hypothetical protein